MHLDPVFSREIGGGHGREDKVEVDGDGEGGGDVCSGDANKYRVVGKGGDID
jgi:hypothetical protein